MYRLLIPLFNGAAYQEWAYKVHFGLVDKKLNTLVFDMPGRARNPCPGVITPITQGFLLLLPLKDRNDTRDENLVGLQHVHLKLRHGWIKT